MTRIIFFFREAIRALRRNGAPTLAAIVTTVVTVVLLGVLIPVFQTAQGKSSEIRGGLYAEYAVYEDATKAERRELRKDLEGIPHVEKVVYVTKAEAIERLRKQISDPSILEQLNSNPLPASFEVYADDAANLAGIRAVVYPKGPEGKPFNPAVANEFPDDSADKIEQVTSAVKVVLSVITALLVLASLMLVGNTIRLSIYTRRREVEVMRLVGATRWFIRWPFMIEGVIVGFAGGLVAILILWLGKITVVDPLSDSINLLAAQGNVGFPTLVAILFGASILVSTLGSGITLRRFLKV
jgi:cell division transport system permease protein